MAATILVLEDDPALQELYRDVLSDEGYSVVAAATLPSLLARLPSAPDLLISDIMLDFEPVGLEAVDAVRRSVDRSVPVILCTGAANQVERFRPHIEKLGATVLAKPFSIDTLLDAVTRALKPVTLYTS